MANLANATTSAVVYIGYTPAPEKKYPTQLIQSYDALVYIVSNAAKYSLNASKVIVMGDSVGANMAFVVSMLSKERAGPKIIYHILLYPVTDAKGETESYDLYKDGPWLTAQSMKWFLDSYEADSVARNMATISIMNAGLEHIKGIAPVLIITAENDVLRDEGEKFAHKLMQANIDVTAVRYLGTIHDFLMLDPLAMTNPTKSAFKLVTVHIKDAIENSR
jgi:acetyl esterase/lipase